jgi:hypothetical protein
MRIWEESFHIYTRPPTVMKFNEYNRAKKEDIFCDSCVYTVLSNDIWRVLLYWEMQRYDLSKWIYFVFSKRDFIIQLLNEKELDNVFVNISDDLYKSKIIYLLWWKTEKESYILYCYGTRS